MPYMFSESVVIGFRSKNIEVLKWLRCSPDMNPIENMWGDLARWVYSGGVKFNSEKKLRKALIKISQKFLF